MSTHSAIIPVWGSGLQYRDFVYVDDITRALLLAPEGANQGVIQISSSEGTNIRSVARAVMAMASKALERDVMPCFDSDGLEGDRGRIAVIDRAHSILGWTPQVDIAQGLVETFVDISFRLHRFLGNVSSIDSDLGDFGYVDPHLLKWLHEVSMSYANQENIQELKNELLTHARRGPYHGAEKKAVSAAPCRRLGTNVSILWIEAHHMIPY